MRFSCLVIGWRFGEGMVEGIGVSSRFIEDFDDECFIMFLIEIL